MARLLGLLELSRKEVIDAAYTTTSFRRAIVTLQQLAPNLLSRRVINFNQSEVNSKHVSRTSKCIGRVRWTPLRSYAPRLHLRRSKERGGQGGTTLISGMCPSQIMSARGLVAISSTPFLIYRVDQSLAGLLGTVRWRRSPYSRTTTQFHPSR